MKLPFYRSYWAEPGFLLAGCYPGDLNPAAATAKLEGLLECGVARVISLMEPGEKGHGGVPFVPYEEPLRQLAAARGRRVDCRRFAIPDLGIPTAARLEEILACLAESHAAGEPVYVHCWGGRGRTGTVVACWLRRRLALTGPAALTRLTELIGPERKRAFGRSPENDLQRDFVEAWAA